VPARTAVPESHRTAGPVGRLGENLLEAFRSDGGRVGVVAKPAVSSDVAQPLRLYEAIALTRPEAVQHSEAAEVVCKLFACHVELARAEPHKRAEQPVGNLAFDG
jgi:hypothetical protein